MTFACNDCETRADEAETWSGSAEVKRNIRLKVFSFVFISLYIYFCFLFSVCSLAHRLPCLALPWVRPMNLSGRHRVNQRVGDLKSNFSPSVCVCMCACVCMFVCVEDVYKVYLHLFLGDAATTFRLASFYGNLFFCILLLLRRLLLLRILLLSLFMQFYGRHRLGRRMRKTMILGACYNEDLQRTIVRLTRYSTQRSCCPLTLSFALAAHATGP